MKSLKYWLFSSKMSFFFVIVLLVVLDIVKVLAEVYQLETFAKFVISWVIVITLACFDSYMKEKLKKENN